jgi:Flp pilus assembly protein TadG
MTNAVLGSSPACDGRQQGGTSVEVALLVPVAMLLILFVLQVCLWAHAANIVSAAASEGAQSASINGGSSSAALDSAQALIHSSGGSVARAPSVTVVRDAGDVVEVEVAATAESIIPWMHLRVDATRGAAIQEFREGE